MGGKRSQRVSARDVEVLGFIARFGVVPRDAVATWAATGRTATIVRERRLREAGLIEVRCGVWGEGKLVAATAPGLRLSGWSPLGRARFSHASLRHDVAVAGVAAALEREGRAVLSERQIIAREREEGARSLSARLGERAFHRCDLIEVGGDGAPATAIEVELTAKGARRLDELLRAWRRTVGEGRFGRVLYRCPPATEEVVKRAIARTRTAEFVGVEAL